MQDILSRIKRLRKEKGLTQADMAQIIGLLRTSYTNKELGRQPITLEELSAIAHALEVPIETLTAGIPPTPIPDEPAFEFVCMADTLPLMDLATQVA